VNNQLHHYYEVCYSAALLALLDYEELYVNYFNRVSVVLVPC